MLISKKIKLKTNILIIGSKGFIGKTLYDEFAKRSLCTVWGCDVVPNDDENYFYVNKSHPDYQDIFAAERFDICINCSGSANVSASMLDPLTDFDQNVRDVHLMLSALEKFNKNCKFINISSAAVYGNASLIPISRDTTPEPISPYGYHKMISEIVLREYSSVYDIKTCSIRIFSAYGNGQKKLLLWDLCNKFFSANHKIPVELFGTGNESRDFIHVMDIVQQIELVIKFALFRGEVYNVANGKEVFIREIVQFVYDEINPECQYFFNGATRPGDPLNWCADISQMTEWGYKQEVRMQEGVRDYIRWFMELKSSA